MLTSVLDEPSLHQRTQQEIHSIHENMKKDAENATTLTEQMEQIDVAENFVLKKTRSTKLPNTLKTPKEKMPLNSIRFNGLQHDIDFDNPNEPRKGFRCKKEGCGQSTTVFCNTCKVHLCFVTGKNGRNCFKRFHNLNES